MNLLPSPDQNPAPEDGVEIHFDEKLGCLELACGRDAFAPYREVARRQLKEFPDISMDGVVEMNIVDTAKFVSRRAAPKRLFRDIAIVLLALTVLALAAIGAYALFTRKIA
jgi:hypothetical protein